jgi:acetyl-CoA C-acetyltransferase
MSLRSISSLGEGLLMAPTIAVPRMLAHAGLSLQDFDFYEIHEAFAAQVLCTLRAWEIADYCRNGSAATSRSARSTRPSSTSTARASRSVIRFGATGTRIIARLPSCWRKRVRARTDLDLHGRRHGRDAILERP